MMIPIRMNPILPSITIIRKSLRGSNAFFQLLDYRECFIQAIPVNEPGKMTVDAIEGLLLVNQIYGFSVVSHAIQRECCSQENVYTMLGHFTTRFCPSVYSIPGQQIYNILQ